MIGFIIAEKEETANFLKIIKAKTIEFSGIRFYVGNYEDKQILVSFCGIGKVNAAATAMNMIVNFNVSKIINIGLCGSARHNILPGSILIANKIENFDVDLTPLNYQLNQLRNEPMYYEIKNEYVLKLQQILGQYTIGTIASGDSFITIDNVEAFPSIANKEVIGIEMEAVAIAQICAKTKTDFICIKVVSDNLTFDKTSKDQYQTNYKDLAKKIEKICINVIKQI